MNMNPCQVSHSCYGVLLRQPKRTNRVSCGGSREVGTVCSTEKRLTGDRECPGMGTANVTGAVDVCRKMAYWKRLGAKISVAN